MSATNDPGANIGRDISAAIDHLTDRHLADLIAYCRSEILARPQLRGVAAQFRIHDSEDWLRQAITLFRMCPKSYSPAFEWHDTVGELNFAAGLSAPDANDCLCILRDGMINLVWTAALASEVPRDQIRQLISAILKAFDCSLDAQTAAYVRESQRHLSEINRDLEFRQSLLERDLSLAKRVQQQFLPGNFISSNFRAEVRYVPTTGIGGDHAGIFPLSDDRLCITICDVTGHGIASALVAAVVSSLLRPLLRQGTAAAAPPPIKPVNLVRKLNTLFFEEFQHLGILLTFLVAIADVRKGTLTYSGAGHPPALLQCCSVHKLTELRSQNIILGAAENCIIGEGETTLPLHSGDRIIFYTDGIIEANNAKGKMLELSGLKKIIRENYETSASQLADQILSTAQEYYDDNETDDMSLILLDVVSHTETIDQQDVWNDSD